MLWLILLLAVIGSMLAVWLIVEGNQAVRELEAIKRAQSDAEDALSSMSRAERRRAHRQLWRDLPTPEE